jgi:hypothetical protein
MISNKILNDERLSGLAKAIMTWRLSKPDDWHCTIPSIMRELGTGQIRTARAMSELRQAGYAALIRRKGPDGRFFTEWHFSEAGNLHGNVLTRHPTPPPSPFPPSEKTHPTPTPSKSCAAPYARNLSNGLMHGKPKNEGPKNEDQSPTTTTTTVQTAGPAAAGVSRESGGGEVRSGSGSESGSEAVALMASAWPGSIRPDEREKAERELDGVATPSAESVEAVKAYYASDSPNKAYSFTQFARTWHRQVIDARAWQATLTPSIESYRERIAREDARAMAQAEARRRAPVEDPIPPGELLGSFMAIIRQQKSLEGHPEEPEPFLAS